MQNMFNAGNPPTMAQLQALGVVNGGVNLIVPGFNGAVPPTPQGMMMQSSSHAGTRTATPPLPMPPSHASVPADDSGNDKPQNGDLTYFSGRKIVNNVVTKIATPYTTGHIPCPYGCGRSFKHATQKAIHVRKVHTGERPFTCEHEGCGRSFYSSGDLKAHGKTHSTTKPFECPECGKSMSSRNSLKVHIKALHTLERPFKCDVPDCGMTYMTRLDLDRHLKKHVMWDQKAAKAKVTQLEKRTAVAERRLKALVEKNEKRDARESKSRPSSSSRHSVPGRFVTCAPGEVVPEGAIACFIPNNPSNPISSLDALEAYEKKATRARGGGKRDGAAATQSGGTTLTADDRSASYDDIALSMLPGFSARSTGGGASSARDRGEDATVQGAGDAKAALALASGGGGGGGGGGKRKATTDPAKPLGVVARKKLLEARMREEYEKKGFKGSIPFQSWRRGMTAADREALERELLLEDVSGASPGQEAAA